MLIWFVVIAAAGLGQLVGHAAILKALLPSYGFAFFAAHPGVSFIALGAIVLTITGAEALYADMGHFGRPPISRAWFFVVFPALTLNYMGQGSLILGQSGLDPQPISASLSELEPDPDRVFGNGSHGDRFSSGDLRRFLRYPPGGPRLGFLPVSRSAHTSAEEIGEVYAPAVNWALFAAVIVLVIGFGSSTKLASAYGIAVTGTITVDTILFLVVAQELWHKPAWAVLAGGAVFFTVDLAFLSANFTKIEHGGWFPLSVGIAVFAILSTWKRGSETVAPPG